MKKTLLFIACSVSCIAAAADDSQVALRVKGNLNLNDTEPLTLQTFRELRDEEWKREEEDGFKPLYNFIQVVTLNPKLGGQKYVHYFDKSAYDKYTGHLYFDKENPVNRLKPYTVRTFSLHKGDGNNAYLMESQKSRQFR